MLRQTQELEVTLEMLPFPSLGGQSQREAIRMIFYLAEFWFSPLVVVEEVPELALELFPLEHKEALEEMLEQLQLNLQMELLIPFKIMHLASLCKPLAAVGVMAVVLPLQD